MSKYSIYIDEGLCKGCGLCCFYCSKDIFKLLDKHNAKGYVIVQVCHPEDCIGCKLCEINCPDFAIYVESIREGRITKNAREPKRDS